MRGLNPLLHLRQERVRDSGPKNGFSERLAHVSGGDMAGDVMVLAPGQFRSSAKRSVQIIRSEYFHDFYVYLRKWASS